MIMICAVAFCLVIAILLFYSLPFIAFLFLIGVLTIKVFLIALAALLIAGAVGILGALWAQYKNYI